VRAQIDPQGSHRKAGGEPCLSGFRPRKILETYVQPPFSDFDEAEKDLRIAVITGEVRARFHGEIIGPETRAEIARSVYDPKSPAALPPDIEISVEDAERVWLLRRG
jgi:hypothetical protein